MIGGVRGTGTAAASGCGPADATLVTPTSGRTKTAKQPVGPVLVMVPRARPPHAGALTQGREPEVEAEHAGGPGLLRRQAARAAAACR